MEADIWIGLMLIGISGIANACMDTLEHHYDTSIFKNWNKDYWHPKGASGNKYNYGDEREGRILWFGIYPKPILLGSGWHLFKSGMLWSGSFGVSVMVLDKWYMLIVGAIVYRLVFGGLFELFYKYILRRK